MRKLTLVLMLAALLIASTAVVYAGWEWDEDSPHIGEDLYLHWTVTADNPPEGWEPDWDHAGVVEIDDGQLEVDASVWVENYDEDEFACTLEVRLTDGKEQKLENLLATVTGSCEEVEVEWSGD